jgi:agmatinase
MYTRDLLPSFAGIATFLRAPTGTTRRLRPGTVAVLGIPHDATSSARQGTRWGPQAIREASADFVYDLQASETHILVDIETGKRLSQPSPEKLTDLADVLLYPTNLARSLASMRRAVQQVVGRRAFLVALGGDAFITYPLLQGAARALGDGKKLGYLQVSSQLNLAEGEATWGKNWAGATARRILESGLVRAQNMTFLGTSGYVLAAEWELACVRGMKVIPARVVTEMGPAKCVEQAVAAAGGECDAIYLSVDIGAVDTASAPGRGEVVIGGMTPAEFIEVMRALSGVRQICAMDLVEVAPTIDPSGRAQRLAAEAIVELISPRALA